MLKIGVTGSIACGKSFIDRLFSVYGVTIIDADVVAREVLLPPSLALEKIASTFGSDMLLEDGSLNRPKLREIVFSNKMSLDALNAIMHPAIQMRITELVELVENGQDLPESYLNLVRSAHNKKAHKTNHQESFLSEDATPEGQAAFTKPLDEKYVLNPLTPAPYVLLDIPLLFENHLDHLVDRILVVDAEPETQIKRIMLRDGGTREKALAIINTQYPREKRLAKADDIIQTDKYDIEEKRQHVLNLHMSYIEMNRNEALKSTR